MKLEPDHRDPTRVQGRRPVRHDRRAAAVFAAIVAGTALLAAPRLAPAQACDGPLPSPAAAAAASAAVPGAKFRLIAGQCEAIAAQPARVHRAAQLDLYEPGSAAVTVTMPADAPPDEAPAPVAPAPRAPVAPDGSAGRVLSLAPAVTATAQAYGVDPLLLHAIAHVESRHRAGAVSPAGARGVMQVMPATGRRFGVGDERALFDPATNLRASAAYLRTLLDRYAGDLRLALAAYNAGEGAVDKHGRDVPPYPETRAYVRDVMAIHRRLTDTFTVTAAGTLARRAPRAR